MALAADNTNYATLSGRKPEGLTVAPGKCQLGEEWEKVKLLEKEQVNHNTVLLTFQTPDAKSALGLSTCACILVRQGDLIRPYTPISTNQMEGKFELLVKHYPQGANGKGPQMSHFLWEMKVDSLLEFKHIKFNVKIQYPFNKKKITMLVGGTGITPMIQALHPILGNAKDTTEVTLLYGSRTETDILGKALLDDWQKSTQLNVVHVLSHEPENSSWKGERGFINEKTLKKYKATPEDGHMIFVCGPPPMYDALCGPRNVKELTGALATMGFKAEDVFKF